MAEEQIQQEIKPAPEKKGKSMVVIIIIVAACLGGGAGFYFFGGQLLGFKSGTHDKVTEKKEAKEAGPTVSLEPFVFNVSGNYSRLAKISVAIELKSEKVVEETKKMMPIIRDTMLSVLSSKTPEVLMDVNGRNQVKKELYEKTAKLFKGDEFKAVYITDIIMQ
jgi:flagellar protein FliL